MHRLIRTLIPFRPIIPRVTTTPVATQRFLIPTTVTDLTSVFRRTLPQISIAQFFRKPVMQNTIPNYSITPTTGIITGRYKFKTPVYQWIAQAGQARGRPFTPQEVDALSIIIKHESGGDPNIKNLWDSNARRGTPSTGLLQTIGPTFRANAMPGHTQKDNPIDEIIAATNYANRRYGGLANVPGVKSIRAGQKYRPY